MSFRAKLLAAFTLAVVLPLLLLAAVVPREMSRRFSAQYSARLQAMSEVVRSATGSTESRNRTGLAAIAAELREDIDVRRALMSESAERGQLLDYSRRAALRTGLDLLQIQNDSGRILSSAHFRNEFDRIDTALPAALRSTADGSGIVKARTATGAMIALARLDTVRIGSRIFTLIGGVKLDSEFLASLTRNPELGIALYLGDSLAISSTAADTSSLMRARSDSILLPFVDATGIESRTGTAQLVLSHSTAQLDALISDARRWILGTLVIATIAALAVAAWLSSRLSGPLAELTAETARIDLDKPSGRFTLANRKDEIGLLAGKLTAMMERVRASATRLRDAERRATMGELARQVNHDIKNGLTPIRNVVRHLGQITRERPSDLPAAFAERQQTLESSIEYLDTLARNYARLSPRMDVTATDVRPVIEDVKRGAQARGVTISAQLPGHVPLVLADAAVLRRVLENLVGNAIDAVDGRSGSVSITAQVENAAAAGNIPMLKLTVSDSGKGMTEEEMRRAFDDFFTTKAGGTGLGLSVVRRLVADVSGILRVESEPGKGTRVMVSIPVAADKSPTDASARLAPHKPVFK